MKILIQLCIMTWSVACCYAFEATVTPANPKAGEAILVRIAGDPADRYEVSYSSREYAPYLRKSGKWEIFLPLPIDESGPAKISVRRITPGGREEKDLAFTVKERVKKVIQLRASDEAMRDNEAMVEQQQQSVLETLQYKSDSRLWTGSFRLPLTNPVSTRFAVHRKGKTYSYYHKGLDFSAPTGTAVRAMNNGKVIMSGKKLNVYGNTLIVDHGQGIITCYFHLSRVLKQEGDTVKRGEIIGRVGSTGWATGPHLHMGVYVQGRPVDPVSWIRFTRELTPKNTKKYAAKPVKKP